jgi:hypothetical protein
MDRGCLFALKRRSMQRFIPCPRCSIWLARDREYAGKLVACSACDHEFVMPFETSKTWCPLSVMPWHFHHALHRLEIVARPVGETS